MSERLTAEERQRVALAIPSVAARIPDIDRVVVVIERVLAERILKARREGAADELEMLMDAGIHPASDTWMRDRATALRGDA